MSWKMFPKKWFDATNKIPPNYAAVYNNPQLQSRMDNLPEHFLPEGPDTRDSIASDEERVNLYNAAFTMKLKQRRLLQSAINDLNTGTRPRRIGEPADAAPLCPPPAEHRRNESERERPYAESFSKELQHSSHSRRRSRTRTHKKRRTKSRASTRSKSKSRR